MYEHEIGDNVMRIMRSTGKCEGKIPIGRHERRFYGEICIGFAETRYAWFDWIHQ